MTYFVRISDYKKLFRPEGPLFACIVPWVLVLAGHQIALCKIIQPTLSLFYLVIIANMFTAVGIAFWLQTIFPLNLSKSLGRAVENTPSYSRYKKRVVVLIGLFLGVEIFQTLYFGGTPLTWLLTGSKKFYVDYGIPSLNGLVNAIYMFCTSFLFVSYLIERSRKKGFLLFALLAIPIIFINRQMLVSTSIQIFCCAFILKPRSTFKYAGWALAVITLFILIGNLRTGLGSLMQILQPADYIPETLYPLLWIYAYLITPFNNLNAAADVVQPAGWPYYELSELLPSVIRTPLLNLWEVPQTGYTLVHNNMTVGTFYISPFLDFGMLYAFLLMIVAQAIFILAYRKVAEKPDILSILQYAILYQIMIMSVFTNLFLKQYILFQLVLLVLLQWKRHSFPSYFRASFTTGQR